MQTLEIDSNATQEVPLLLAGPIPPAALSPADSCYNDTIDPLPTDVPLPGAWWHPRDWWARWKGWLGRDINMVSSAILIGFICTLVVVTLAGVAFAAELPPATTTTGYWLAVESNGTVDFLTGIPSTNGNFSGQEYTVAPGQHQPTIAAIAGTVRNGVVTITERDSVAVHIIGRITHTDGNASITFGFATFHASNWDDYKNTLRHQGGH